MFGTLDRTFAAFATKRTVTSTFLAVAIITATIAIWFHFRWGYVEWIFILPSLFFVICAVVATNMSNTMYDRSMLGIFIVLFPAVFIFSVLSFSPDILFGIRYGALCLVGVGCITGLLYLAVESDESVRETLANVFGREVLIPKVNLATAIKYYNYSFASWMADEYENYIWKRISTDKLLFGEQLSVNAGNIGPHNLILRQGGERYIIYLIEGTQPKDKLVFFTIPSRTDWNKQVCIGIPKRMLSKPSPFRPLKLKI